MTKVSNIYFSSNHVLYWQKIAIDIMADLEFV